MVSKLYLTAFKIKGNLKLSNSHDFQTNLSNVLVLVLEKIVVLVLVFVIVLVYSFSTVLNIFPKS